jgi:phage host-nuclease inhibitor protein Gam
MKRNLNDYKKEMKDLEARSERIHRASSDEINHTGTQKRATHVTAPLSIKWARLMPVLMAILMAALTLLFLIISHALNNY